MSQPKTKVIRLVLVFSVILNIGLISYYCLVWTNLNTIDNTIQQSKNMHSDSPRYYLGRDEVFRKLPNDSNEIIMLGNSLTHNFEWHEIFTEINIKNRGINGDVTLGLLMRLPEITESAPSKIFIEIGINDIQQGITTENIVNNYKKILDKIATDSPSTKVYVQNILPSHVNLYGSDDNIMDKIRTVNESLKVLCGNHHVTYIDLFSSFEANNKLNPDLDCGDHLHLSGKGYIKWCNLIEESIYE